MAQHGQGIFWECLEMFDLKGHENLDPVRQRDIRIVGQGCGLGGGAAYGPLR